MSAQPAPALSAPLGFSAAALQILTWSYHTVPVANSTSMMSFRPPSSRMVRLIFPASLARRRLSGLCDRASQSFRMSPARSSRST